MEMILHC